MKRIIFLLVLCFLFCGCNEKTLNYERASITNITYNGITLLNEDYERLDTLLKLIPFSKKEIKKEWKNDVTITTKNEIHHVTFTDDAIRYQSSDTVLYSKDKKRIKEFADYLMHLKEIYTSDNFYTLKTIQSYVPKEDMPYIKLDQGNEFIILNSTLDLYNVKINEIEYANDHFNEIDLLYQNEKINANQDIAIRITTPAGTPNIKIRFETKYHYTVSIIPTLSGMDNHISFLTELKANENS